MRISRLLLNSTLALSLPLMAQAQQPAAPAIPRAEPATAPSGQQPARAPAQPGQIQPAPLQPGRVQPATTPPGQTQGQAQPSQTQPNRTTVNKPVVGDHSNQQTTRQVASLLAICNHKEVKLAELAKQKSESKDVKEYAEMMIKDHNDMVSKLSQFGGQSGLDSASTHSSAATTPAAAQNRPATNAATGMQGGGLDFVAVQRHAAQECLSKAEKNWSEHKSADADMAYIGAQVVAHEEMINQATALRPYASPELQKEIDKGIEAAKHHRDEAHKIIKKLSQDEKKT